MVQDDVQPATPTDAAPRSLQNALRRSARFSLRTFLIMVTLIGIWLAMHLRATERQKLAISRVREYGGWIRYDYSFSDNDFDPKRESAVPKWLLESLGVDFFHGVREVNLVYSSDAGSRLENDNLKPAPMAEILAFPKLRGLLMHDKQATDDGLAQVAKLRHLEKLFMWDAYDVSDAGVAHLGKLPKLEYLHLSTSGVTDESLLTLSSVETLEGLSLQFNQFSSAGVSQLAKLPRLRSLWVCGREGDEFEVEMKNLIDDEALEFLFQLEAFESLGVQSTNVTAEFEKRMKARFPKCSVHR